MSNQPGSQPRNTPRHVTAILFLLIVLLALALRFYRMGAQSLWNDEGSSVALAQRDLVTIARDAAQDIHPPLYYWLLTGWVGLVGASEIGVRSLSGVLGVILVVCTYVLGRLLVGHWAGLAAALLAAINPFQIYYSQEARMYMLAAVLAAGSILALVRFVREESRLALLALTALEAAGLYTHYSFTFIILILNLAYASLLRRGTCTKQVVRWLASQAAVLVVFVPWAPIALRQTATWPSPPQATPLWPALVDAWRWLLFGPAVETSQIAWCLLLAAIVVVFGAVSRGLGWVAVSALPNWWAAGLLTFWLVLPAALIFGLGLYREAYLKFLLVASPAVIILLSCGLFSPTRAEMHGKQSAGRVTFCGSSLALYALRLVQLLAASAILAVSALTLRHYYAEPTYARDDYRSIAMYIEAVGQPGDAVLLNAPGQQEVFGYYYEGDLPVYPLPASRPLDPAATSAALAECARPGGRVFAVLWATDESDPQRFIEGWLDSHAYKALDSWFGNVRMVVYAVPEGIPSAPAHPLQIPFGEEHGGDEIMLLGYSLQSSRLVAGDIAQITLFWQTATTPLQRYKVFLHLLDDRDHIIGQQDTEPGGGAKLTTLWEPGEVMADHYGVPIHPATPPGQYRVEVGMYDLETGGRLTTPDGASQVWLEPLTVDRPPAAAPIVALGMQHPGRTDFGELTLLGYDAYRLGSAHQPEAPLHPGDLLHINLYWQAETQPSTGWQVMIVLEDGDGQEQASITAEPAPGHVMSHWRAGDVWRGQFNLALPGDLPAGRFRLRIQPLPPDGTLPDAFLSEPLHVEP